jgi:hypothetical protein
MDCNRIRAPLSSVSTICRLLGESPSSELDAQSCFAYSPSLPVVVWGPLFGSEGSGLDRNRLGTPSVYFPLISVWSRAQTILRSPAVGTMALTNSGSESQPPNPSTPCIAEQMYQDDSQPGLISETGPACVLHSTKPVRPSDRSDRMDNPTMIPQKEVEADLSLTTVWAWWESVRRLGTGVLVGDRLTFQTIVDQSPVTPHQTALNPSKQAPWMPWAHAVAPGYSANEEWYEGTISRMRAKGHACRLQCWSRRWRGHAASVK